MSAPLNVLAASEEIAAVVALMDSCQLCPSFLSIMEPGDLPYEGAARIGVRNPAWDREGGRDVPEWIDGDPIYPESPDARRFFGNFTGVSRVFTIDTDDEGQIAQMRAAIAANLAKFGGAA